MTDPKFQQTPGRNLLAPVLVAFLVLGIVIALVIRYTPHTIADVTVVHAVAYPAHTTFKSESILVGRNRSQDDLYALVTVDIDDRLNLPIFIKDFTGTLITQDGEQITGTAAQKDDLEKIYTSFPELRPLSSSPLLRETLIAPGNSAQGMVLLHFPIPSEVWNNRRSAILNIDLYHQGPQQVAIPQDVKASPPAKGTNTLE